MGGVDTAFNSWDLNLVPANNDFTSVTDTGFMGPRQADGSLPAIDFMKLRAGSQMIDKGTNVGIAFVGSAPDLGAYEFGAPTTGTGGAAGGGGSAGTGGASGVDAGGATTGGGGAGGGGTGGAGTGTGSGGAGAGTGSGGAGSGGSGVGDGSGGNGPALGGPAVSGGCACSIGAPAGGASLVSVLAGLAAMGLVLRRRRRPRRHYRQE
jgi:MYXO-CTERM domain-containing protein